MSSPAKAKQHNLGDRKPTSTADRGEFWMKCNLALSQNCEGERWVKLRGAESQKKMKAVEWIKACEPCSYRARGERKEYYNDVDMPCGGVAQFGNRNGRRKPNVLCGICGTGRFQRIEPAEAENGLRRSICDDCKPWAAIAMEPEQYLKSTPKREATYAKIKRLRLALESNVEPPTGSTMPFMALVRHYNSSKNKKWSFIDRLLVLYFDEKPLSEIDTAAILAFCDFLRNDVARNGSPRAPHTIDLIFLRLRHIFEHARWERWVKENPVPKRAEIVPEFLKRRPGRPAEDRTAEHEQLKARFESVVIKLAQQLPPHKIKRPAIVAEYASRGERIDQSTITKRVQLLYEGNISVADVVALVLSKNREINSDN